VHFAQRALVLRRVHIVLQYFLRRQISLVRRQRVGPFHLLNLSVQNLARLFILIHQFKVLNKIRLFLLSFRTAHFFGQIILGLCEVDSLSAFLDLFDDSFGTVLVRVFHWGLVWVFCWGYFIYLLF
jgi:hypothetical protein